MATILPSSSYQTYSGSRVDLVIAYTASTIPVSFKIHKNPMYNESIFEVGGSYTGGVWYTTLTNQIPSSWITISINENGVWSSPHTFYILDDQNYASQYIPSYMPFIRHQWVRDDATDSYIEESGNCVACALATMKEIHEYKEGKGSQQFYSTGWIYGNRLPSHSQNEGMIYTEALDQLKSDGVPYYKLLLENANYLYPDNYFYTKTYPRTITAKQLVTNNRTGVLDLSKPQRISEYTSYNQWVFANIKARIIADGCVLITCDLYNNCYPHSNGIFPENISGSFIDGHMMAIIGWKKINNKNYWICANSWGSWNGDNGLYYMPFVTDIPSNFYFVTDGNYPAPAPSIPSPPLIDTTAFQGGYFENEGQGGWTLKWGISDGATKYRVKVERIYDGYVYPEFEFTSNRGVIFPVNIGTTHYVSVKAGNNSGVWSDYSSKSQATTAPQTPFISTSNKTATSVRINLGAISGDWTRVEIYRRNASDTILGTATITKTSNKYIDYNLTDGTYKFDARAFLTVNSVDIKSVYLSNQIELTFSSRPNNFSWVYPKISGQPFKVTSAEWLSFVSRINEFRRYKGKSDYNFTTSTTYVSQGKTFYAWIFNEARNAIADINTTGLPAVKSSGNVCYADDYNKLVTCLNNIT